MSPPRSESDLNKKIKEEPTAKESLQRSRWLAVVATGAVCLVTAVDFVRYDPLNQVTTLQGLLDSAHRENAESATILSRQKQRIADFEGATGQIDLLSVQSIENVYSLRELSSRSMTGSVIPDEAEPADLSTARAAMIEESNEELT